MNCKAKTTVGPARVFCVGKTANSKKNNRRRRKAKEKGSGSRSKLFSKVGFIHIDSTTQQQQQQQQQHMRGRKKETDETLIQSITDRHTIHLFFLVGYCSSCSWLLAFVS